MIHILHPQTDELVGILDNKGDRIYWDDMHKQGIDGYNVLQFVTYADIDESAFLGKRSRILVKSESEYFQEFIVFESTADTSRNLDVVAVGSETDIDKQVIITPKKYQTLTTEQYITMALRNTEWQMGLIELSGSRTIEVDSYIGGYQFLRQIADEFEMELVFRIEVSGNTITGRFVDLVFATGEDNAKEIVYGKDLVGIERKVFSERIVSAIFTIGPEAEEGNRLTTLVKDDEAFQRWNRKGVDIVGIHEVQSEDGEMTMKRLKELGAMELKKRIDAVTEYTVIAESIEKLYPHEKVRLGDMVRVIDTQFKPPLYATARVIEVERSLTDIVPKVYTIGNVVEYEADELRAAFIGMQKQYGTTVVRAPQPPTGKYNVIWIDTSGRIDVAYTWGGVQWEKFVPTEAGDIGAITPDESHAIAEVENIRTIQRIITSMKSEQDLEYATLDGNEFIAGTIYRTELDAAKLDADNKYDRAMLLALAITTSGKITPSQRTNLVTYLDEVNQAQALLNSYLVRAFEYAATAQAQAAREQADIARQAAEDALTKAETALTDVISKVDQSEYDIKIGEIFEALGDVDLPFIVGPTAPVGPTVNDLWYDSSTNVFRRWDGTAWVGMEVDLDNLDTYTKTYIDNALKGKVGTVEYKADKSGILANIQNNVTEIAQNATDITLKAEQSFVDLMAGNVSDNTAAIGINAEQITLKASSESVTALTNELTEIQDNVSASELRLSDVEVAISDSAIISTVTSSTQFEAMFDTKANAEDLAGYATSDAVSNVMGEVSKIGDELRGIKFGEFVTETQLNQRDLALVASISASSGVNLIKNSVGLAKLDYWTIGGNGSISPTGSNELTGLGYHSGFYLDSSGTGITKMSQDVGVVVGQPYTLSYALRNINTNPNVVVRVLNAVTGAVVATAPSVTESGSGKYTTKSITFTAPSNQIKVEIAAPQGKQAIITALMMNIGTVAFSWTTAVGELYNTTIKMDLSGLRVSQYDGELETGFTVMTPEKFAGYYNASGIINENVGSDDEVFRMDKEEFVMKKANVKEEITMGNIKVLNIDEFSRKGWAFVPNL